MDKILIKDLLVRCSIGVEDHERRERQDVMINLVLSANLRKASRSDRIEDAVNYREIKKEIIRAAEGGEYRLVETLAERIAGICLRDPRVARAKVMVEKPSALRFARSVGVEVERYRDMASTNRAFIGVGSNINPEQNIASALRMLKDEVVIRQISTFYRTLAIGNANSHDFINGVVEIETSLSPEQLKQGLLLRIEALHGRRRSQDKNADRTIDLDLLIHGALVDEYLPDPEITKRAFLAIPLFELDPELVLPGSGISIREVVRALSDQGIKALPEYTDLVREQALSL